MDLLRIAARISASLSQPLSERPDYGAVAQEQEEEECSGHVSEQEQQGVIRKTPGKGYCVKSEKNPDWNGGCFPSKGKAEKRLDQVEYFKHKGSVNVSPDDVVLIIASSGSPRLYVGERYATSLADANDAVSKTFAQESVAADPMEINIPYFEWDPGDERSFGTFNIQIQTPLGDLIGEGLISSNSTAEEQKWTLAGKPIPPGVSPPELAIPHYKAGGKAIARYEQANQAEIKSTISEWIAKNSALLGQVE